MSETPAQQSSQQLSPLQGLDLNNPATQQLLGLLGSQLASSSTPAQPHTKADAGEHQKGKAKKPQEAPWTHEEERFLAECRLEEKRKERETKQQDQKAAGKTRTSRVIICPLNCCLLRQTSAAVLLIQYGCCRTNIRPGLISSTQLSMNSSHMCTNADNLTRSVTSSATWSGCTELKLTKSARANSNRRKQGHRTHKKILCSTPQTGIYGTSSDRSTTSPLQTKLSRQTWALFLNQEHVANSHVTNMQVLI